MSSLIGRVNSRKAAIPTFVILNFLDPRLSLQMKVYAISFGGSRFLPARRRYFPYFNGFLSASLTDAFPAECLIFNFFRCLCINENMGCWSGDIFCYSCTGDLSWFFQLNQEGPVSRTASKCIRLTVHSF